MGHGAQSAGQSADGAIIGTGLRLDGRNPLTLPASPSLAVAKRRVLEPVALVQSRSFAAERGDLQPS